MKRYILNGQINKERRKEYDVVIVGSGIAGLYSALHLSPELRVAIVTKAEFERSSSWLAQGGIASVIAPDDFYDSHIEDTLKAGAGLCDRRAVELLVEEGPRDIRELIELSVPFDRNPEGELEITREGGHSRRRIVHCCGDATGRETTRRLGEIVLERKNIDIFFETFLIDIVTDDAGVCGAIVYDKEPWFISCPNVILATGGIGQLYLSTTNPSGSIGDGISVAKRAGADIFGMELVQFHPTTLFKGQNVERAFLISEAVRGEGGILRNKNGEAFMQGIHPLADLAPRDIVARAIIREMNKEGSDNVFLDVSSMSEDFFSHRFPTIFEECRRRGVDLPSEYIPVRPGQHYLMGGIKTSLDAESTVKGIYACGETASTGVHGANRLASNSMLECLVFGRRAAEHITKNFVPCRGFDLSSITESGSVKLSRSQISEKKEALRAVMTKYTGPVRTYSGLAEGKKIIDEIMANADELILEAPWEFEYYNMVMSAKMIVEGACERKESIGAHYVINE